MYTIEELTNMSYKQLYNLIRSEKIQRKKSDTKKSDLIRLISENNNSYTRKSMDAFRKCMDDETVDISCYFDAVDSKNGKKKLNQLLELNCKSICLDSISTLTPVAVLTDKNNRNIAVQTTDGAVRVARNTTIPKDVYRIQLNNTRDIEKSPRLTSIDSKKLVSKIPKGDAVQTLKKPSMDGAMLSGIKQGVKLKAVKLQPKPKKHSNFLSKIEMRRHFVSPEDEDDDGDDWS